jgi:hypothetical protein
MISNKIIKYCQIRLQNKCQNRATDINVKTNAGNIINEVTKIGVHDKNNLMV